MTRGLVTDSVIEQIQINAPPVDLSNIPEIHRKRFFNPQELETLVWLLRSGNVAQHVETVMEIGCQNGRTAKVVLDNNPQIKTYIGIDIPPNETAECAVQKNETPRQAGELAFCEDGRFFLLLAKSGSRYLLQLNLQKQFDAVFIDGDHSREAVLRDHKTAFSLVKKGGLIIHHDYHDLGTVGVKQALQELALHTKFYHVAGTWLCYTIVEK